MKKRLFVVLAVLALTVCLLPMVVGATEACEHDANGVYRETVSEATCTEAGQWIDWASCTKCGKVLSRKISSGTTAAPGHTPATRTETTQPTCLENGAVVTITYCSVCNNTLRSTTEVLPHPGHTPATRTETTAEPKCGIAGEETVTTYCSVCGNTLSTRRNPIAALVCDEDGVIPAVAPSCFTAGKTAGTKCSKCGRDMTHGTTIPAYNSHDVNNIEDVRETVTPATCTVAEVYKINKKCLRCNKIISYGREQTGEKLPHNPVVDEAKAPECGVTGLTEGSHCGVCNTVIVAQNTIPALKHDNQGEKKPVKNPTCTETGVMGVFCSKCGVQVGTETNPIAKLPHTEAIDEAVAPTCDKTGLTEGKHCSVCNEVLVKQEVVKALGHKWDDGVVTKKATYGDTGIMTYTCSVCGAKYEEATPVLQWVNDPSLDVVPRTGNAFVEWLYALIAG